MSSLSCPPTCMRQHLYVYRYRCYRKHPHPIKSCSAASTSHSQRTNPCVSEDDTRSGFVECRESSTRDSRIVTLLGLVSFLVDGFGVGNITTICFGGRKREGAERVVPRATASSPRYIGQEGTRRYRRMVNTPRPSVPGLPSKAQDHDARNTKLDVYGAAMERYPAPTQPSEKTVKT